MDQITSSIKRAEYILRYLRNEITPAEMQELEFWLQESSDNRKLFEEAINEAYFKAEVKKIDEVNVAKGWDELLNKVNDSVKDVSVSNSRRWWYVAAAAILLMGVFTIYKYSSQKQPDDNKIVENKVPANDVAPGGDRAILQLADGSTIILDSSSNGNIANQGQTTIIKIDGQLAYNSAGSSKEILYNTISTPRGGQYQLILADGTKVWLNAASSLRFPTNFTGNERKVTLTGEGYFEVAKNINMPFKVDVASKGEVEVLGTHFNVNAYEDEASLKTTLLEGKVRVGNGNNKLEINPGQQAEIALNSNTIILNKNADLEKAVAWKNGYFNFNGTRLKEVMKQLMRWYDIEVLYENEVPDIEFYGKLSRGNTLNNTIAALEYAGVHFRIAGRKLIVLQ